MFQDIINFLYDLPWASIIAVFGAGGIVSLTVLTLKHKFSVDKNLHLYVVLLSGLVALLNGLNQAIAQDPKLLGAQTAMVAFAATTIYRFPIRPLFLWFSSLHQDASELRQQSAPTPAPDAPAGGEFA